MAPAALSLPVKLVPHAAQKRQGAEQGEAQREQGRGVAGQRLLRRGCRVAAAAPALCRLLTILRCMPVDVYDVLLARMAVAVGRRAGSGSDNGRRVCRAKLA